jgi:hypothetical protein
MLCRNRVADMKDEPRIGSRSTPRRALDCPSTEPSGSYSRDHLHFPASHDQIATGERKLLLTTAGCEKGKALDMPDSSLERYTVAAAE